jgi:DNA-binding transcriptional LysR family regulator
MTFKRGQLLYFVTVADEGQFTRAAAKLHVAQPTLSQAIAELETELGIELLERHARGATLTAAGEAFLPKARNAVVKEQDAVLTARALARAAKGAIAVGFIGPPPTINAPELFIAFAEAHAQADVSYRDLPFPCGSTASWLEGVDVAFCHPPDLEARVQIRAVRPEQRAVVTHRGHPLGERAELAVADVLDETFVNYHPQVQRAWAGFHSFDDHRGGPPARMTCDRASTALQLLGLMSSRETITALPFSDATLAQRVLPDVAAIPVRDARPAVLSLVWRTDNRNPLVAALVAFAEKLAASGAED